jgi:TfoX/Sxy family transcriptional regulator of competence genes
MDFPKPTQHTLDTWEAVAPPPPAERRKMFGMPCAFVNGNMCAGVYGNTIMLRLSDADRSKLEKLDGGGPFEAQGRTMREYGAITAPLLEDRAKVRAWVKKAIAHTASLPAKAPKKPAQKAAKRAVPDRTKR